MTLKFVDTLPEIKGRRISHRDSVNRVQELICDFTDRPGKIAEIELDFQESYKDVLSFYTAVAHAVKRSGRPVKAVRRGDKVYLVKD